MWMWMNGAVKTYKWEGREAHEGCREGGRGRNNWQCVQCAACSQTMMWQCSCPHVHPLHPVALLPYTLTPIMPTQYESSLTARRTAQDSSCHWTSVKRALFPGANTASVVKKILHFDTAQIKVCFNQRTWKAYRMWKIYRPTRCGRGLDKQGYSLKHRSHLPLQPCAAKTPPHREYNDGTCWKNKVPSFTIKSCNTSCNNTILPWYFFLPSFHFNLLFIFSCCCIPFKECPLCNSSPLAPVQLPSSFSGNHRG